MSTPCSVGRCERPPFYTRCWTSVKRSFDRWLGPNSPIISKFANANWNSQISNVRGQLAPLEAELAQIRKMRSLIADARAAGLTDLASDAQLGEPPPPAQIPSAGYVIDLSDPLVINGRVTRSTIKLMVLSALRDHFKSKGATPTELRDYIKAAFDRDVDRNSISPQLARLREQGAVESYGFDGKWKLTRAGALYDHSSSWKDLDKDEPPDPNAPNTRLGDIVAQPKKKDDDFLG